MDQLAVANSVRWHGDVQRVIGAVLRRTLQCKGQWGRGGL